MPISRFEDSGIVLDLDRDRICTVLREAYNRCQDMLGVEFNISERDFVNKIIPYLDSNRVSIPVELVLPSAKYPELRIRINLRTKKVMARLANRKKQAYLNYYLNLL